jgi:hypothetical protein
MTGTREETTMRASSTVALKAFFGIAHKWGLSSEQERIILGVPKSTLYRWKIKNKPLHDIRKTKFKKLHHPQDYTDSQMFGKELKKINSWGLIYHSVRHTGGKCIAIFRAPAITIPIQTSHLRYVWNGGKIVDVLSIKSIL